MRITWILVGVVVGLLVGFLINEQIRPPTWREYLFSQMGAEVFAILPADMMPDYEQSLREAAQAGDIALSDSRFSMLIIVWGVVGGALGYVFHRWRHPNE